MAAFKKEVQSLMQRWEVSQTRLRASMETMKTDLKEFTELQEELSAFTAPRHQEMLVQTSVVAAADLDTLRREMEKLNAYIHTWNQQSRSFNELIRKVEEGEVKLPEARQRIAKLREFEAGAMVWMEQVDVVLKDFTTRYTQLDGELNSLKNSMRLSKL